MIRSNQGTENLSIEAVQKLLRSYQNDSSQVVRVMFVEVRTQTRYRFAHKKLLFVSTLNHLLKKGLPHRKYKVHFARLS